MQDCPVMRVIPVEERDQWPGVNKYLRHGLRSEMSHLATLQ